MGRGKHISGIYLIVSPSNGRYIGSSKSIGKRWNRYKNLSCKNQFALFNSFNKYGVENHTFKIIYYCPAAELLFWERAFGDIYLSLADFENGLNIRLPGYNEPSRSYSEEAIKRVRAGCKKRWDRPEERQKTSEKAKKAMQDPSLRERLKEAAIQQWSSEESREKKSEERKKYFQDNPDSIKKHSDIMKEYIKQNPEQAKKNFSAIQKYYIDNPTKRSEMAKERYKNHDHPTAKKVINKKTGEIFKSCAQAAKELGCSPEGLRRKLVGKDRNNTNCEYL